ncbi:MAG TPA: hypothetical protein ENH82_15180 [bacterium]|nr:hypothetical protein [bacterium]
MWKSLKFEEPKFIDSKNPEKFLSETIESKKSGLVIHLFVWAVFGLGPALVILAFLGILTYALDRKFKNGGSNGAKYPPVFYSTKFTLDFRDIFCINLSNKIKSFPWHLPAPPSLMRSGGSCR